MRRILKYSLVAFAILSSANLFAQKKWSLEECISYALQNNIQVKREALQVQRSKDDKLSAYLGFTPTIGAQATHYIERGKFFSQISGGFVNNTQEGSLGLGGSMDLFHGFTRWNYLAQTKYDLLASIEGTEELKWNISLNITAKYLEVLYATESYNLAVNRLEVSNRQVESSQHQYELGKISNGEFMQIKSQAISEKVQLTDAFNALTMSTLELSQMLELPSADSFNIVTDNLIITSDTSKISVNQYIEESFNSMASIRKAGYNKKSAEYRYKQAIGSALPYLTLNYQISSSYSDLAYIANDTGAIVKKYPNYTYSQQVKDNIQKYVSFQLTIPIYGRLQNYIRISKAKIDKIDASYAVEETKKNVLKGVQQAYTDAKGGYYRYQSMLEAEKSYNEVFEMNKEKFNLGMINAVDYGIARNNLIKAQGDLLHAKYTYILKLKILDFYRGVPISL